MESLTQKQIKEFKGAKNCHTCEKPFNAHDIKYHDHCHFIGKYRGPAHQGCNLSYKDSNAIFIAFHNLSSYDSHFFY